MGVPTSLKIQELEKTLLIVTHDQEFAKATDRTIEMEDGKVVKQHIG
jgi:lipoprotein-releasing system ATP-binding protein